MTKNLFFVWSLGFMGCVGERSAPLPVCEPSRDVWTSSVRAHVERHCGDCHGATPRFGATRSLVDFDALVAQTGERRLVDRVAARLADGSMPPPGSPSPPDHVAQTIASWASCGAVTLPPGRRLRASAPRFRSPEVTPPGLTAWELRAGGHALPSDRPDHYQCFGFDAPVAADRFVRRFEMIYDRAEVLHHLVVFRDAQRRSPLGAFDCDGMPEGSHYLYAWAPGEQAFEFPSGGIRLRPADRYVVQIHYNNGALVQGLRDDSGVRVLHGPPEGVEYGMVAIGPVSFSLPPRAETAVASRCTIPRETRVLAGMPHMHRLGASFDQTHVSNGASAHYFSLQNWAFETQIFYALPSTLRPGDVLETRCTFSNPTNAAVSSGSRTANEMCFQFMYVTPPWDGAYCDEGAGDAPVYTPGACLDGAAAPGSLPRVTGPLAVGTVDALGGPELPARRWVLTSTRVLLRSATTPVGAVDLAASTTAARAWALTAPGRLLLDGAVHIDFHLAAGSRLSRDQAVSLDLQPGADAAPYATRCAVPASIAQRVSWALHGDELEVTAQIGGAMAPLGAWAVLRFRGE